MGHLGSGGDPLVPGWCVWEAECSPGGCREGTRPVPGSGRCPEPEATGLAEPGWSPCSGQEAQATANWICERGAVCAESFQSAGPGGNWIPGSWLGLSTLILLCGARAAAPSGRLSIMSTYYLAPARPAPEAPWSSVSHLETNPFAPMSRWALGWPEPGGHLAWVVTKVCGAS